VTSRSRVFDPLSCQRIAVAADGLPAVDICSPCEVVLAFTRRVDLTNVARQILNHKAGVRHSYETFLFDKHRVDVVIRL
jgi:hypothetical protein